MKRGDKVWVVRCGPGGRRRTWRLELCFVESIADGSFPRSVAFVVNARGYMHMVAIKYAFATRQAAERHHKELRAAHHTA